MELDNRPNGQWMEADLSLFLQLESAKKKVPSNSRQIGITKCGRNEVKRPGHCSMIHESLES